MGQDTLPQPPPHPSPEHRLRVGAFVTPEAVARAFARHCPGIGFSAFLVPHFPTATVGQDAAGALRTQTVQHGREQLYGMRGALVDQQDLAGA